MTRSLFSLVLLLLGKELKYVIHFFWQFFFFFASLEPYLDSLSEPEGRAGYYIRIWFGAAAAAAPCISSLLFMLSDSPEAIHSCLSSWCLPELLSAHSSTESNHGWDTPSRNSKFCNPLLPTFVVN
jgi:hypothetical protein